MNFILNVVQFRVRGFCGNGVGVLLYCVADTIFRVFGLVW